MRKFGLAAAMAGGLWAACVPGSPDVDFGGAGSLEGGDGDPRESGIRILSDVTAPGRDAGSGGRGGAAGASTRDVFASDNGAAGAVDEDGAASDGGSEAGDPNDAHVDDASVAPSDAASDRRDARADGDRLDASQANDRTYANDSSDAADTGEASVVLGTCGEVRACVRSAGQTEQGCLRSAAAAARVTAEPLLACELAACPTACRAAYALAGCNACLLHACPAALVACAEQSGCGDGVVAGETEECDDGNASDRDACTAACTSARCGDGIVYEGQEACDDGNATDTDACLGSCRRAACGDGVVWAGVEGCDDGNGTGGDGCSAACLIESCGNGVVDPGEECDDGAKNGDDMPCLPLCRVNRCGDGKTCRGDGCGARLGTLLESCDDGNDVNSDACVTGCRAAACGDGYVRDGVETCDDGNADRFDGCGDCATAAGHLLLTEIVTRPAGAEMIEIVNPTRFAVALSDYLVSDSHLYHEVAAGTFATASGSDFAARFPDGAMLEPGHYAVVALGNASGGSQSFAATYGKVPDFELRPTANQATDDPAVPNMVAAGSGSIGANASLTDGGELVVLFVYRGGDLVSDVDYVFYGEPSASNQMVDKTGIVAGASSYLADTPPTAQHAAAAPSEVGSLHRCVYAESRETTVKGNGITGHDETSEDVSVAFAVGTTEAERTPGGPPPASVCPAGERDAR